MSEMKMSLRDTCAPKSDQLNYDDLAGGASVNVRVVGLSAGSAEQPVVVRIVNDATGESMRDYKPCKSMRRVLIAAWGDKGKDWVGKRATLVGDPTVKYGGVAVGGIRVSHVSGIGEPLRLPLTVTRGRRQECVVGVLADKTEG